MPGHKLAKVTQNACVVTDVSGKEVSLPCDNVVLAMGFRPDKTLENSLAGKVKRLSVVGDAITTGKIINARWQAYLAVNAFTEIVNSQ